MKRKNNIKSILKNIGVIILTIVMLITPILVNEYSNTPNEWMSYILLFCDGTLIYLALRKYFNCERW